MSSWFRRRMRSRSMPSLLSIQDYDPRYQGIGPTFAELMRRFFNCDWQLAEERWEFLVSEFVKDGYEVPDAVYRTFVGLLAAIREREATLPDCSGAG